MRDLDIGGYLQDCSFGGCDRPRTSVSPLCKGHRQQERRSKTLTPLPPLNLPHGRKRYGAGCRCDECRAAHAAHTRGLRAKDPEAHRKANRASYEKHAERRRAEKRNYRAGNLDLVRSQDSARHARNRDERVAATRRYHDKNHDAIRSRLRQQYRNDPNWRTTVLEVNRDYRRRNPLKMRAKSQRRRARQREADHGCVTVEHVARLLQEPCAYCGVPAEHIDHIHPLAKGGLHCVENLAPACVACNCAKGATILDPKFAPTALIPCPIRMDLPAAA